MGQDLFDRFGNAFAALVEPVTGDRPSTPPSPYNRAVWGCDFPQVTVKKKGLGDKIVQALDRAFAAYWCSKHRLGKTSRLCAIARIRRQGRSVRVLSISTICAPMP